MAIQEFGFDEVSISDLEECVEWFKEELNLRDWDVKVEWVGLVDNQFDDIADVNIEEDYLRAVIRVNDKRCLRENHNPYQAVAHEMLHVLTLGVGSASPGDSELVSYRLEYILTKIYYMVLCRKAPGDRK